LAKNLHLDFILQKNCPVAADDRGVLQMKASSVEAIFVQTKVFHKNSTFSALINQHKTANYIPWIVFCLAFLI
jgi:hypothetical protein